MGMHTVCWAGGLWWGYRGSRDKHAPEVLPQHKSLTTGCWQNKPCLAQPSRCHNVSYHKVAKILFRSVTVSLCCVLCMLCPVLQIRNLQNEVTKKCAPPCATTDAVFYAGTGLLLCRSEDKVCVLVCHA